MPGGALDRATIQQMLQATPPLVEGYPNLKRQLQPNGFDLTLREVAAFDEAGQLGIDEAQRRLAETTPIPFNGNSFLELAPGPYLITFNEVVNLPLDIMALGRPRSSLLRSGVAVHTAVWDAGYSGRSQALLAVYHPQGFRIAQDTRVLQLVFFRLEQSVMEGYQGRFQREGLG